MIRMGKWKIDLPDYFVARYFHEFVTWAKQIPTGEFKCTRLITFNEGGLADDSPDPEQGKELLGAWLFARVGRRFIECEPYRDLDRDLIRRHCAKMQAAGVHSRDRLVEPPRPGIPILPIGNNGNGR
jgi:hypothetical protein